LIVLQHVDERAGALVIFGVLALIDMTIFFVSCLTWSVIVLQ